MPIALPQHEEQGSALDPPRFSLRALLSAMTALGCLFGLMSAVGRTWSLLLVFFLSLVVAHVLGNSVGTKLRDRASRRVGPAGSQSRAEADFLGKAAIAGPERLTQRARLSRITLVMSIGGALAGGTMGAARFSETYPDSSLAAVGVGVISSAVLGTFAGFTASSFLSVARQALREALADCDPAGPSHRPH